MSPAEELKSLLGTPAEQAELVAQLGRYLPAAQAARLRRILELVICLLGLLELKNLTLAKLRRLCFGERTESARNLCGGEAAPKTRKKAKGHGRQGQRAYPGARRVSVPHPTRRAGETCPACQRGKLRRRRQPGVATHLTAQPPVAATIYELESLRCDTCGKVFTAPPPPEAGKEKYDPSVGVLVGWLRYGGGLPHCRLERMQQSLGVPLPASVQWEQVARVARDLEPVLKHLIGLAAQSRLFYNDDTSMRVSALRQEIREDPQAKRTGIFTSGIVSQSERHPIALFFTGRRHAGENLARVLARREPDRAPPLHMRDGLDRNDPAGHATVPCGCAVHARRNFVELQADFPEECRRVIESFAEIYRVEAQAKAGGLNPQARLAAHQATSQRVMDELAAWFKSLQEARQVEPNSGLGQAIAYMQKRWPELTQFLRVPGAPLDNNAAERILKLAILHRKNSLFYRTQRGAEVGDLFMSLIETCRANQANPFDYLLAVVRNAPAAQASPDRWMPWNYQDNPAPTSETESVTARN